MTVIEEMSLIRDVASWQEYIDERVKVKGGTKLTGRKVKVWKGYVEIDTVYNSPAEKLAAFQALNDAYKAKFAALTSNSPEDIRVMQDWHAKQLRELSGRDPSDGREIIKPKKLDIVKLAEKFGIAPGSDGWESRIVQLVEKDMHIGEDYVEEEG